MHLRTFWSISPLGSNTPLVNCSGLVLFFLLLFPQFLLANFAELAYVTDQNFYDWEDSGSMSMTMEFCAASAKSPGQGSGVDTYSYNLKLESLDNNADFFLYKDGDTSNSGDERIALTASHRSVSINSFLTLSQGVYDARNHAGDNRECPSTGENAELRLDLDGSQLGQKRSGEYFGQFRLTMLGGRNTTTEAFVDFQVRVEVVATLSGVKISGLDDLQLGQHSGLGDIQASEHFCVFSDDDSYRLSVSGGNQGVNGVFALEGPVTGDSIPITVAFADSGSGTAFNPVGSGPVTGTGSSSALDCGGTTNATLTVTALEQDLQKASSGVYSETLILLVQPE